LKSNPESDAPENPQPVGSNIDGRTTRHDGYRISQVIRKRIEEANGWVKEVGAGEVPRPRPGGLDVYVEGGSL